ncbi:hypothetical protein BDF20DRAFT_860386 [Mycotypha africana]|uniref:uncharacterized protein n=1 Tax=Mycotypha africana TaxID=64632 RepID=UPI0022FFFB32|nr:uncharacterized protein BDF20DRAFT_860386 [Mycotypha africana]KAI8984525.1 hypothetical protein BDF20DRAFT_860386 [Mycotypha africana]
MNHNRQSYPYQQYQQYYQQYYYNVNAPPQVPQGDPSAALTSVMFQYQQPSLPLSPSQQQQLPQQLNYHYGQPPPTYPYSNSHLNGTHNNYMQFQQPSNQYYADYYALPDQRSIVKYDDLSQPITDNNTTKDTTNKPEQPKNRSKLCCNKWLKSSTAIAQHEKLHIKCPSCDFMCLPSVMAEHEEVYHGKINEDKKKKPPKADGIVPPNAPKIETPEELEAWIAARKKNWPTKANLERKQQEEAERIAKGELPKSNKRRKLNNYQQQRQQQQQILQQQQLNTESLDLEASTSTSLVAAAYDSDNSDDFMDPEKDAITSKDPSAMGKILLPPEEIPRKRCKWFALGRCKKGDQCTFLHQKPEHKKNQPPQPKSAVTFKRRPNLLYKLLEKEIRQEKSAILQCLRYIVDNNYLGEGGSQKANQSAILESNKEAIETECLTDAQTGENIGKRSASTGMIVAVPTVSDATSTAD